MLSNKKFASLSQFAQFGLESAQKMDSSAAAQILGGTNGGNQTDPPEIDIE